MEIKIKTQKDNPFLERKEIVVEASEKTTPSYAALKVELAKKFKSSEDTIVIKRIDQQFGKPDVAVNVYLYASPEAAKKYEKVKVKKAASAAK